MSNGNQCAEIRLSVNAEYISYVDGMTDRFVRGWILDPARPFDTVDVELVIDGYVVQAVSANYPRDDLLIAGFATSEHGFVFPLAQPLISGQTIEVRTADGTHAVPWHVAPVFAPDPVLASARLGVASEAELTIALNADRIAKGLATLPYRSLVAAFEEEPLATLIYHAATLP